jgi:hypothetical protein
VDTGVEPPQAVWRWWLGTVKSIDGERAVVALGRGEGRGMVVEARVVEPMQSRLHSGELVFLAGHGDGARVLDVALNGLPADPASIRASAFSDIEAAYAAS